MPMRYVTMILVCLTTPFCGAEAQFGLSADVHLFSYGGVSHDTSAGNVGQSFRPFRPLLVALRPEWTFGRVRIGLGIAYGAPDIAEDGGPLALVLHDTGKLLEISPEGSYRLARLPRGLSVRIHAGPLISIWKLNGEDGVRTRAGGLVALSAEFPVTTKLQGFIRVSGAVTEKLFHQSDLPPEFKVERMRRAGIGLGLRYGP
jgi:hypothetical protein